MMAMKEIDDYMNYYTCYRLSDINDDNIVLPVCNNDVLDEVDLVLLQQRLYLDPNNRKYFDHVLKQITSISTTLVLKSSKLHSKHQPRYIV